MGSGAMLFKAIDGVEQPIAFASKTFTEAEQRRSASERELFVIFWAIRKWQSSLLGQKFYVQTNHRNILNLSKVVAPKVVRWRLVMQLFDYVPMYVAGESEKHAIVDRLSRLHGPVRKSVFLQRQL